MRLKNKKTGVIVDLVKGCIKDSYYGQKIEIKPLAISNKEGYMYNSLAELNENWEDAPEEPKNPYFINWFGEISELSGYISDKEIKKLKLIGNYFDTREEAEKAVERLRAWKRLKDKGFEFRWIDMQTGQIKYSFFLEKGQKFTRGDEDDLLLLFGGEE